MSDSTNLPVAPEFAEILADTALKTVIDYLQEQGFPEDFIQLINHIHGIGYYLQECYRAPQTLMRDQKDRFDIEAISIECINAIAQFGGSFRGPWKDSVSREVVKPVKIKKA